MLWINNKLELHTEEVFMFSVGFGIVVEFDGRKIQFDSWKI